MKTQHIGNVLFLCTGNSARSILSEAILNRLGEGRFRAFSAGSKPVGRVNPGALALLQERSYSTEELRSILWLIVALYSVTPGATSVSKRS